MSSRRLVFSDGSSDKFWNIELDDCAHTVNFGRQGTNGQTKTKEFDDATAAKKSFDKLIEQKIKKGYVDADGGDAPATDATSSKTVKKKTATKKKAAPKPKAATKKAEPAAASDDVVLEVTQEIDLKPADWFMAGFRKPEPLTLGEPPEADLDGLEKRLASLKLSRFGWTIPFEKLKLPPIMAREDAHLLFLAMASERGRIQNQELLKKHVGKIRAKEDITGDLTQEQAIELIESSSFDVPTEAMIALFSMLSAEECFEVMLQDYGEKRRTHSVSTVGLTLCDGFRAHVLPYLSDATIKKLQTRVRQTFDPNGQPASRYDAYPTEHYAAAMLGMHEEVYEAVSSWDDGLFSKTEAWAYQYQRPHSLLFGLASGELVESEWRRLKLKISDPLAARGFLACTEFSALDILGEQVCQQSNKDEATALLKVLCLVRAPEAAEPMLQCRASSKVPALAREWMAHNVGNCARGLVDVAGSKSQLADAAIEYLRSLKRNGYESVIAESVANAGKDSAGAARIQRDVLDHEEKVYDPLDEKTTPKWLKDALEKTELAKKPKLPPWASPNDLPPLLVGGHRLNDDQMNTVLTVMATIPVSEKHELLDAIKQNVDKQVRDEFAWSLFQRWQEDGSVSKNKWAMGSIGHIGDDGCVLKLTPMVRVWPGESQHARAVFGLECLRGVGSNVALMQLSGIAQKLKFKGLKAKAAAFVEDIAKEKGMTRAELEDRVIPDCGLDEMGRREFSFGPRSFSFVLGGDLKPMVRDAAGKIRPNMPKPGVKDDADVANESISEWKLIKKQIKEVATLQAGRLEQAMVTGRRWTVSDYESLLVRHPLMTHLAQKVIWGEFDAKGKRKSLFRVSEERDYADANDDALTLSADSQIGVMHALDLTEDECSSWGEVLSDYEIISPFPQLGREVYSLEKGEEKKKELDRFHGMKLAAPTMVFTLEKLGYVRGEAMDGGCFDEHSKQFPAADVTAVIGYDGVVAMGYIDPEEELATESIHFCKGMRAPSGYRWESKQTMKLGDVPPIVLSEVMADLSVLKTKAR